MRILVSFGGLLLLAGCSSVPMQPVQKVSDNCDYAQMQKQEAARQPIIVERYWIHCPQIHETGKSS